MKWLILYGTPVLGLPCGLDETPGQKKGHREVTLFNIISIAMVMRICASSGLPDNAPDRHTQGVWTADDRRGKTCGDLP